ncbi:MAG: ABC transporter permease [Candidatus Caldarchaeum sp.]|nr:ABC transporter permease [Candidatus Caldarchaeum sp.]
MLQTLKHNLKAVYARTYVRVISTFREPEWIFTESLIPLLVVFAAATLYRVSGSEQLAGFAVVGGAMMAFWDNVLWLMASQFYWEKESGNLDLYIIAPISKMSILLGMSVGSIINTSVRAVLIVLIATYVLNIRVNVADPLAVLLVFVMTMSALYGLGMLMSSLYMLYGRGAYNLNDILSEPVYLLSGLYFPTIGRFSPFPWVVQFLASLIPLTFGIDGLRRTIILGQTVSEILPHIGVLSILSLVLIPLAWRTLIFMENLGRREGRLSLRWI